MAKVLVTGANGFIGTRLTKALTEKSYEVICHSRKDADLSDRAAVAALPRADIVVHLAGRTFVPDSWIDPASFMTSNLVGTTNVLEFCKTHGARMIFVSAYIYGIPKRLPVSEEDVPEPNNPYALSKYFAEKACRFYHETHGVNVTVLRPFNILGPGQSERFLVSRIISQARTRNRIDLDDLSPRRDYVDVDDVVRAIELTVKSSSNDYRVFNIGSGESFSVGEIALLVQEMMGTHFEINSSGARRKNEIPDVVADIRAAKKQLGWTPKYSLRGSIEKMIAGNQS